MERLSTGKANGVAEGTEKGSVTHRDVFEYSSEFEALTTYSRETSRRSEVTSGVAYVSSTTNTASTGQLRYIPQLLAAKMAHLPTTSTGPVINSGADYQNYQNAMATIKGDHSKMYCPSEYRYSQKGGNSYGLTDPEHSCAAFAFATALSMKYGRKITPADVDTTKEGYMLTETLSSSVSEWSAGDKKGYWISASSESETLLGIDAQLQLGNPVLIHVVKDPQNSYEQHWAVVTGKQNGKYTIIDPYDGTERSLENMEIYRKGASIQDYVILSDEY